MSATNSPQLVLMFWAAFDQFDFEAAGELLHDEFVFEMPQSKERIRGRANFVAFNAHYLGRWHISIQRLVASEDNVVTEVSASHEEQMLTAISFFRIHDGKIAYIHEFWPEPFPAQTWRAQWVEVME